MNHQDALVLSSTTAEAVAEYLRGRCYPEARTRRLGRGFGIEVSEGRMVIVDPDDWHSDAKTIIRKVIEKAKEGNLDAVRFLMEHSDFRLPSFSAKDEEEE